MIGVNPSTPYQNPKQLLDAMKAKPGAIPVATAGVTSAGHNAMELIAKATGVTYRHVTYDGGNPAVVATVAGEAEVTTQLAVEQADMIRGKRLRPLATVSDKPLELEGYGTIPPLAQTLPGFTAPANYFGIFIPKGVPDDVVKTIEKALGREHRQERGDQEVRDEPRRAVRAVVRRGGAEGGVPGDPGQRLAALQRRQGQGLARHGRHPEALTPARAEQPCRAAATSPGPTFRPRKRAPSPRASCAAASAWTVFGIAVLAISWRMDRLEAQHINPYTVPGLLPGLLGIVTILLGGLLALRSWRRGGAPRPRAAVRDERRVGATARARHRPDRRLHRRPARPRPAVLARRDDLRDGVDRPPAGAAARRRRTRADAARDRRSRSRSAWRRAGSSRWVFQDAFLVRLP